MQKGKTAGHGRNRRSNRRRNAAAALLVLVAGLVVSACNRAEPPAPPPPKVVVARPVEREVTEWDEYTARLEATDYVEVRARVSGYLEAIGFKEGAVVYRGDLLFKIDPRPYEATLKQAEADLAVAKARLELANKNLARAKTLVGRNAISQEEADTRAAEANQAAAAVAAAEAAVEAARLNVEFTEVRAPIAGRVGRYYVTEGNLINGGSGTQGTLLTTIVSLDPVYAYFEADEASFLKYQRLAENGVRESSRDVPNPVYVGLADEEGFPHPGHMDFVDNQLDPGTGTIIGRAVVPNPGLTLTPGLFARLRLLGRGKYDAILIPDAAVSSDQANKFVYTVDDENVVRYAPVTLGPVVDGLRVVRTGLEPEDRVIVSGVQRVRPGITVQAEEQPAPVQTAKQEKQAP